MRSARAISLVVFTTVVTGAIAGCAGQPQKNDEGSKAPRLGPGETALVPYCNGQTMQITEPKRMLRPGPAAIYLHGGSWMGGDHNSGGFIIDAIGEALNNSGFVVASANYRLGPDELWPAQIVDAKCAVRYLRANARVLGIDPDEIGIWGHSAGAHLASLVGTAGPEAGWDVGPYSSESSRVEAVADLAGPADLVTLEDEGAPGVVKDNFVTLLGHVPQDQLEGELKAASPVTYVSTGDPPFLIIHGDMDQIVPIAQSEELAKDLEAAGVPETLVVVRGGGHSLDEPGADPDPEQIEAMVVDFFVTNLERPR